LSTGRPRVLFAGLYPSAQAGTRLRALAWFDDLRRAGVEPELWTFVTESDSDAWFGEAGSLRRLAIAARGLLRAVWLWLRMSRYDVVVVLREVLPVATTVMERRAAAVARVVWDVDDALWTPYPRMFLTAVPDRLRRTPRKYEDIARLSAEVWAGGEGIAEWCAERAATDVWVLPTVPELPTDVPGLAERDGVVWVGSQSTAPFVQQALAALQGNVDVPVTLVGARLDDVPDAGARQLPWSESTEGEVLRRARVGLYPLDLAHPLAADRAGFKAALYMAYGLPCVVTPARAVAELVRHGVEGLHARTADEWAGAVGRLLEDDDVWTELHLAARARAAETYSVPVWSPRVAERVARLAFRPS
jgi:hypothetical protein